MENTYEKYFLAANSCEGFVSHFDGCYNAVDGWRCIIIKGGPGTGKSSFMKYIAARAADKGYGMALCPCSSDPDSLDAVIIADIKTVLLDGTAPHVVEPRYPGACEEILNLGEFWDGKALMGARDKIIETTNHNKALHKTASRYLAACGQLLYDNLKLSLLNTDTTRVCAAAEKIADKVISITKNTGSEQIRFITGVTPRGVVSYADTVNKNYRQKIIIEDKFGAVATTFMNTVRKIALARGYKILTLKNAFLPSDITDHILIPELSIAFVSENGYIDFGGEERRIHARRFSDVKALRALRSRMFFNRRVTRELLFNVCSTLQRAKEVHDTLEKYYVDAMDFKAIASLAPDIADKILG